MGVFSPLSEKPIKDIPVRASLINFNDCKLGIIISISAQKYRKNLKYDSYIFPPPRN